MEKNGGCNLVVCMCGQVRARRPPAPGPRAARPRPSAGARRAALDPAALRRAAALRHRGAAVAARARRAQLRRRRGGRARRSAPRLLALGHRAERGRLAAAQAFCWLCGERTGREHTWTTISGHSCGRYSEETSQRVDEAQRNVKRYTVRARAARAPLWLRPPRTASARASPDHQAVLRHPAIGLEAVRSRLVEKGN